MIFVAGVIHLGDGEIDRLADVFEAQMQQTRAEDGCIQYDFSRHMTDPNMLLISERWRDEAALNAHLTSPDMDGFNAAIGGATITSVSVKAYGVASERTLMGE
jgi:quinol monooxygenase YgiN